MADLFSDALDDVLAGFMSVLVFAGIPDFEMTRAAKKQDFVFQTGVAAKSTITRR